MLSKAPRDSIHLRNFLVLRSSIVELSKYPSSSTPLRDLSTISITPLPWNSLQISWFSSSGHAAWSSWVTYSRSWDCLCASCETCDLAFSKIRDFSSSLSSSHRSTRGGTALKYLIRPGVPPSAPPFLPLHGLGRFAILHVRIVVFVPEVPASSSQLHGDLRRPIRWHV